MRFFIIVFIFSFFISFQLTAAPHPMMGSALINQVGSGSVFSQMGFQIKNLPSDWILKTPLNSNVLELGPGNNARKSILSFMSEKINLKTDLEKYVRQYLRDYNQYGFEVVNLQSLKQGNLNSVIVDLNEKNKATRSRQIFYKKEDQIIMAMCLDTFEQFDKTILTCNKVLESFQWR